MEDLTLFKSKLEELINQYPKSNFTMDFSNILKELNKYSAIVLPSKNIFSKFINFIHSKFNRNISNETIQKKINILKIQAAKIFAKNIVLSQNPVVDCKSYVHKSSEDLFFSLQTLEKLNTCLTKTNNTYKLYPIPIETGNVDSSYLSHISQISYEFFSCDLSLNKLFDKHNKTIQENIQTIREDFLQSDFAPYYGDVDFLVERASYILECMNDIVNSSSVNEENKKKYN